MKGLHSGLALSPFGPAFAFPVCHAPQGRGMSAEARAEEKTCKLLPICLLSEGLRLGRDSIVLMDSEHQGLPRKDKSLTGNNTWLYFGASVFGFPCLHMQHHKCVQTHQWHSCSVTNLV